MSSRNVRKMYGDNRLPASDEGEDFEEAFVKRHTNNLFVGLEVSSNSSDQAESDKDVPETPKRKNNKNNKQKKKKKERKNQHKNIDDPDKLLMEINAILGEPEEAPKKPPPTDQNQTNPETEKKHKLFTITKLHLDSDAEFTRKFGAAKGEDSTYSKKHGRQIKSRLAKAVIVKSDTVFKKRDLSMDIEKRENGLIYFAFIHSKAYQRLHNSFRHTLEQEIMGSLDESQRNMHVEGLLELADRLFFMDKYREATTVIENIIVYMQQCAHPSFNVTDMRVRLLYKHLENRAFHIALFKHMYLLSNRACHRTALELAKLLLNLDPSDPLAVLLAIDTIAIRAGENEWLIEAIEYWSDERDARYLFNMMYSLALAEFRVAMQRPGENVKKSEKKQKKVRDKFNMTSVLNRSTDPDIPLSPDVFIKSDELLTKAMLHFPSVLVEILKDAGITNKKITSCPLFDVKNTIGGLRDLIKLYSKGIWRKFNEEFAMKWLIRNATALVEKYESDPSLQAMAKDISMRRANLFQTFPPEIWRHLHLITSISNTIIDEDLPIVVKVSSFDPEPPLDGVSGYHRSTSYIVETVEETPSILEFFSSMLPGHELMD